MTTYDALTPEHAAVALGAVGVLVEPEHIRITQRDDRWLAHLPERRLAWFAASDAALTRARVERRLLRVLEARCRIAVPRVLVASPDGGFDVRTMVPGVHDPAAVLARLRADSEGARRIGTALGRVIAELHACLTADDVAAWIPHRPEWPKPRTWIRERLPAVVGDTALHSAADEVMARFDDALNEAADGRVLVHADLGLHNATVDLVTFEILGVFDWESACWTDPHLDFRYFLFEPGRFDTLDAALAAYEQATGRAMSRDRVLLHNAAAAIGFLAFRDGVPAEEVWCGRTLAEDLQWTRSAIAQVMAARR